MNKRPANRATRRQRPAPARRRGFTFVELLVVLGIIALLVSMLMPTLRVARQVAERTQCASQLRQLGMALMLYANANR